jgi:ketosteroid isomerase-like protein
VAKKLKRIDIVKRDDHWVGERQGSKRVYVQGSTKEMAVRRAAKKAKRDPRAVSVRIHGRDGRIQEERTYPRTVDPSSSKG